VRSPPSEEEGEAKTTRDELTSTPIPVPLRRSGGGRKEIGSKAEPEKKGGVGEDVLRLSFYFSLPYSNLIGNKLK